MMHLRPRPFRDPALAALAVVAMGTGIATFAAAVVSARAFIPDLPVEDPSRVVQLATTGPDSPVPFGSLTRSQIDGIREGAHALEAVGGVRRTAVHVTSEGVVPARARAALLTGDVFRALRVEPVLGRTLRPEDEVEESEPVLVLGHGLWERVFAEDPDVLGRAVALNGREATVVGVMPAGFAFPLMEELWLPLARTEPREVAGGEVPLIGIGRLRDGASVESARAELRAVSTRLERADAADSGGSPVFTARRWVEMRRDGDAEAGAMPAVVGFSILILVVACANVALLFLVRALHAGQATAIRMALGARRGTVVLERLIETLVLALVGGVLGSVLILVWTTAVRRASAGYLTWGVEFAMDWGVVAATATAVIVAALVAGLVPALRGTDLDLSETLRQGPAGGGSIRLGRAAGVLLVLEVAFSCAVLVGIGHSLRGLRSTLHSALDDPRVPVERTLVAQYELLDTRHPDPAERSESYRRVARALEAHPEVDAVLTADALPGVVPGFGARRSEILVTGPGRGEEEARRVVTYSVSASPGYFDFFDARVLRGRGLDWEDRPDREKVVVVNESFARRWLPGREVVGARVALVPGEWRRVVGVVSDVALRRPDGRADGIYLPISEPRGPLWLMASTRGDPLALAPVLRDAVRQEDPQAPVWEVNTLEGVLVAAFRAARILGDSFGVFALSALLVTAVGLHAVMAFTVGQRTREIAVRSALGSPAASLGWRLFRGTGVQVALGVVLGVTLAWWLSPLMGFGLLGADPRDPLLYVLVATLVVVSAAVAGLAPLTGALRLQIAQALRVE